MPEAQNLLGNKRIEMFAQLFGHRSTSEKKTKFHVSIERVIRQVRAGHKSAFIHNSAFGMKLTGFAMPINTTSFERPRINLCNVFQSLERTKRINRQLLL